MLEFYGITEIQTDNNLLLMKLYFYLMRERKTLFISLKAFPVARFGKYLEKSGIILSRFEHPLFFTFYESRELVEFIMNKMEFILRKEEISLIILNEIDFIFLERPLISVDVLHKIFGKLKEINRDVEILSKLMEKRSCQFLSLKMEYFFDWRYCLTQKDGKIYLKDHIMGNLSEIYLP